MNGRHGGCRAGAAAGPRGVVHHRLAENAVVGNGHLGPCMAVMTKPFAMDDLARKIREMIEQ